jgi:hypothetical protein
MPAARTIAHLIPGGHEQKVGVHSVAGRRAGTYKGHPEGKVLPSVGELAHPPGGQHLACLHLAVRPALLVPVVQVVRLEHILTCTQKPQPAECPSLATCSSQYCPVCGLPASLCRACVRHCAANCTLVLTMRGVTATASHLTGTRCTCQQAPARRVCPKELTFTVTANPDGAKQLGACEPRAALDAPR